MYNRFAQEKVISGRPGTGLTVMMIITGCPERGCRLRASGSCGPLATGAGATVCIYGTAGTGGRMWDFMAALTTVLVTSALVIWVDAGTAGTLPTIAR